MLHSGPSKLRIFLTENPQSQSIASPKSKHFSPNTATIVNSMSHTTLGGFFLTLKNIITTIKKISPRACFYFRGSPGGSRTRDFLDENQASWTTRRRDHRLPVLDYIIALPKILAQFSCSLVKIEIASTKR